MCFALRGLRGSGREPGKGQRRSYRVALAVWQSFAASEIAMNLKRNEGFDLPTDRLPLCLDVASPSPSLSVSLR